MTEEPANRTPSEFDRAIEPRIKHALDVLALARTVFSSERAVMSWMRTSVSLYVFGFSITKFVAYLEEQQPGIQFPGGARHLGMLLIIVAIAALIVAITEHRRRLRIMVGKGLPQFGRRSLPIYGCLALFALGIITLIGLSPN